MSRPASLLLVFIAALSLSCSKHSTGPDNTFSLKLSVADGRGIPVSGLRVSLINDLSASYVFLNRARVNPSSSLAVTTFGVEAPVAFHGSLTVESLKGVDVAGLFDASLRPAGVYTVNWDVPDGLSSGVYRCRFVATDSAGTTILFRDSIFASLYANDPALCVIGWTDASGNFETTDESAFPNLLGLPPIPLTGSAGPTVIGSFIYSDSVAVTLTDTLNHLGMVSRTLIRQGPNSMSVVWTPTLTGSAPDIGGKSAIVPPVAGPSPVVPKAWKLRQNYPNPFN